MTILQTSLLSLIIAQIIKVFTSRPLDFSRVLNSGGMPSSHAAFVSSLSTLIGLRYGFDSDLFAIVTVFSLIIIYDAGGVRRAVGIQANILNRLINHLEQGKTLLKEDLKELIGHTPIEVLAGVLLGIIIALISYHYFF